MNRKEWLGVWTLTVALALMGFGLAFGQYDPATYPGTIPYQQLKNTQFDLTAYPIVGLRLSSSQFDLGGTNITITNISGITGGSLWRDATNYLQPTNSTYDGFRIANDVGVFPNDSTRFFDGSGHWSIPGGSGGTNGITINPTDGRYPYRINTNSFGDGQWFRVRTNMIGFISTNVFLVVTNDPVLKMYDPHGVSMDDPLMSLGYNNTFVGVDSGKAITSGVENSGFGWESLKILTTGSYNTAVGEAMGVSDHGNKNTAVGWRANRAQDGDNNVAIGYRAMQDNSTNSIFVGSESGVVTDGITNVIAIGFDTKATNNNEIVIGNTNNSKVIFPITSYSGKGTNVLTDDGTFKSFSGMVTTNGGTIAAGDIAEFGASSTIIGKASSAHMQVVLGPIYQATNSTLTALSTNTTTGTGRIVLESAAGTTETNLMTAINVRDAAWGATGDGVTDDTTAIQAALNYATNGLPAHAYSTDNLYIPPESRRVYFPKGTYKITAPLKVFSYTRLEGENSGSVIWASHTNAPAIYIGYNNNDPFAYTNAAPWRMSRGITMEKLSVIGNLVTTNAHSANSITNHGIQLDGALRCKFVDMTIRNFYGAAIQSSRSEFCEFLRVYANFSRVGVDKDSSTATGDATGSDNCTDTFRDCRFQVNNVGVRIKGSAASVFTRCEIEDNVSQIWNATTDGLYNGTKKEPDAFYLPSVGVWFGTNAQNNLFEGCYIEDNYVHVYYETNCGGIVGNLFRSCTFNPTDSVSKPDSEWCAKHDIMYRVNLVNKAGIADGTNNQAHVVFATLASGNAFEDCHFHGQSEPIPAAGKADCKRIVFTTDNYTYPLFTKCFGLVFDDATAIWGGTNPRVTLDIFPPASQNSIGYVSGLAAVNWINGKVATAPGATLVGTFPKPFVWDAAYVGANNLVQEGWVGDSSSQRATWKTLNHRVGLASAIPTTGAWNRGDVVWNNTTTNWAASGWICMEGGTPGSWKVFGTDHINYDAAGAGTAPYAPFGITRTNQNASLSYLAMVRDSTYMWGLGINGTNDLVIGTPDTNKQIPSPFMFMNTAGNSVWTGSMHVGSDVIATGNVGTSTNSAFYFGSTPGVSQTNIWQGIGSNWTQVVQGGIVTSMSSAANGISPGGGIAGTLITNGAAISQGDLVAYGSTLTNTAKATLANITNAMGIFTGSTTSFLAADGTMRTPGGGGNVSNTGASVVGMVPTYTDVSGTAVTPTNTITVPLFSTASTTNGPGTLEFATAGWVRSLFATGTILYNSGDTNASGFDSPTFAYVATIPTNGSRTYLSGVLTNNAYFGSVMTTNTYTRISGDVLIQPYMMSSGGAASANYTVHAEVYYTYDKTNLLGDWESGVQTLLHGTATNRYSFVVPVPTTVATNTTGFYIVRRMKVNVQTGADDIKLCYGTNTPSQISLPTPAANAGNLVNTGASTVGMFPIYTDTTGTQVTPTNALDTLDVTTLTLSGLTASSLAGFGSATNLTNYTVSSAFHIAGTALSLSNTTVTAGAYTNASITVGADGRITAAANGAGVTMEMLTNGTLNLVVDTVDATTITTPQVSKANWIVGLGASTNLTDATVGMVTNLLSADGSTNKYFGADGGWHTVSSGGLTSGDITNALGFVPANSNLVNNALSDKANIMSPSFGNTVILTNGTAAWALGVDVPTEPHLSATTNGTVKNFDVNGASGDITSKGTFTSLAFVPNTLAGIGATTNLTNITISSDLRLDGTALSLSNTTVTAASYTNATLTVDAKGRITAATNGTTVGSLGVTTDGGGSACTTGVKGYVVVPYTGYITGWSIVSDGSSPTNQWDVWKVAAGTALPTVGNTITASAKPYLNSGNVARSTAVSTWGTGTNLTAGDIIGFNLDGVAVGTRITLTLETLR